MASKKDKVRKALREVGAAFSRRDDRYTDPNDPLGAQVRGEKMYHIHPDATRPDAGAVLRFRTLDQIMAWVEAVREANAVWEAARAKMSDEYTDADEDIEAAAAIAADQIMSNFWESLID